MESSKCIENMKFVKLRTLGTHVFMKKKQLSFYDESTLIALAIG
jgi:hypothetical protein